MLTENYSVRWIWKMGQVLKDDWWRMIANRRRDSNDRGEKIRREWGSTCARNGWEHVLTFFRLFVYWWDQMRVAFVLFELWRTPNDFKPKEQKEKRGSVAFVSAQSGNEIIRRELGSHKTARGRRQGWTNRALTPISWRCRICPVCKLLDAQDKVIPTSPWFMSYSRTRSTFNSSAIDLPELCSASTKRGNFFKRWIVT